MLGFTGRHATLALMVFVAMFLLLPGCVDEYHKRQVKINKPAMPEWAESSDQADTFQLIREECKQACEGQNLEYANGQKYEIVERNGKFYAKDVVCICADYSMIKK